MALSWMLSRLLFWRRGGNHLLGHTEKSFQRVESELVVKLLRDMYCGAAPGAQCSSPASHEHCR